MSSAWTDIGSTADAVLAGIAGALQAASGKLVTRSYREFDTRSIDELRTGVWTLLARGLVEDSGEYQIQALLIGQLTVPEGTDPQEVERRELAMADDILCLISGLYGVGLRLRGLRQSMHIEAPDGWVAADIDIGPLSLYEEPPVITFVGAD